MSRNGLGLLPRAREIELSLIVSTIRILKRTLLGSFLLLS